MPSDHKNLTRIRDSIEFIDKAAASDKQLFLQDEQFQHSVFLHMQTIAQAISSLSPYLRSQYPDVNWPKVMAMQSLLDYRTSESVPEVLWLSVEQDIPLLRHEIKGIFQTIETQQSSGDL
jgi:uncharacterized protein with HEPN domain